jgi:hypothetical protein
MMSALNRLSFLAFCLFLLAYCQEEPSQEITYRLCSNEVSLLASDSLPHLGITIETLHDRDPSRLDSIFEIQGSFMRYTMEHELENGQSIMIHVITTDYNRLTDAPPLMNPFVHGIHVYLTRSDSVIVKQESSSLLNIQNQVKEHYSQINESRYPLIVFYIFWDIGVDDSLLNRMVSEIILGYTGVANEKSMEWFGKPVCELSKKEFVELSDKLPFRLSIAMGKMIGLDFMTAEQRSKWFPIRFR